MAISNSILRVFFVSSFLLFIPLSAICKPQFKVLEIKEGLLVIKSKTTIAKGSHVLIHRKSNGLLDILARGKVAAQQGRTVYIRLELDSVRKVPRIGDQIVFMAAPIGGSDSGVKKEGSVVSDEVPLPPEPGFIQWTTGNLSGGLLADNSTRANAFKEPSAYGLNYWQLKWFFEFVWRMGFSYESWSGTFPTETYFRNFGDSILEGSQLAILFRFRPWMNGYFRTTLKFLNYTEDFESFNPDEALISSLMGGVGLGARFAGEFTSPAWSPKVKYFHLGLHEVYLDIHYLKLNVQDTGLISRGTDGSGSSAIEYRLGLTGFLYLPWIPMFKRLTVTAFYGAKTYDISFNGPTTSEVGGIYTIPEGGSYKESYTYFMVSFGFRLDDFIGKFLEPK